MAHYNNMVSTLVQESADQHLPLFEKKKKTLSQLTSLQKKNLHYNKPLQSVHSQCLK